MTNWTDIGVTANRVLERLVAGLELEFGRGAGEALAARFLDAEESDFVWEARMCERWLGAWETEGDEALELDRVAVLGWLDGTWFAGVSIVDGEGRAHGLVARRACPSEREAREAYVALR